MMKKFIIIFSFLSLLFSSTPLDVIASSHHVHSHEHEHAHEHDLDCNDWDESHEASADDHHCIVHCSSCAHMALSFDSLNLGFDFNFGSEKLKSFYDQIYQNPTLLPDFRPPINHA